MGTKEDNILSSDDGLHGNDGIARTKEYINAKQGLNPTNRRVLNKDFFYFNFLLLKQAGLIAHPSNRGRNTDTVIGQS